MKQNENNNTQSNSLEDRAIDSMKGYRETNSNLLALLNEIANDWQIKDCGTKQQDREEALGGAKEVISEQVNRFTDVSIRAIDLCLEIANKAKDQDEKTFNTMLDQAIRLTHDFRIIGSSQCGYFNAVYKKVIAALASVEKPDYKKIDNLYGSWINELCMNGGTYHDSYWQKHLADASGQRALLLVCKFPDKQYEVESMLQQNKRTAYTSDAKREQAHAHLAEAILLCNKAKQDLADSRTPQDQRVSFVDAAKAIERGMQILGHASNPPAWGSNPIELCAELYADCLNRINTVNDLNELGSSYGDLGFHACNEDREVALSMLERKLAVTQDLLGTDSEQLVDLMKSIARSYLYLDKPEASYDMLCRAKEIYQGSAENKTLRDRALEEFCLMQDLSRTLTKMNRKEEADRLRKEYDDEFGVNKDKPEAQ